MHHGLEHGLLSELTVLLLEVRNLHFVGGILLLVGGIPLLLSASAQKVPIFIVLSTSLSSSSHTISCSRHRAGCVSADASAWARRRKGRAGSGLDVEPL